jgi:amidohydrolase
MRELIKYIMDIKKKITSLKDELIELRRDFHKHPELGFEEYKTAEIVANYLEKYGLNVKRGVAKTGVVGLLKGEFQGPTLLLRADMDALPIQEENEVPYKSVNNGVMHACGHDGHIAILLVAAKILSDYREKIKGNIKFVFQPNEEVAGGAETMIKEGILENPRVDAALGIHLWSPIDTGKIGIVSGPFMGSSYYFKLIVIGKGGHGGAPHTSIDPVICAANIIQTVQTIQTREIDALKPTIITFCKIKCGSSNIIIPDKIELEGSIRCLYKGSMEPRDRFKRIVKHICEAHRTTYELKFKCGNRLLSNDDNITELVKTVAKKVVKPENIQTSNIRMLIGEDFAEFALRVPSAFYFIGTGNKEKKTDYPHHHSRFNIDEDSLSIGVEMHIRTALKYLNSSN